jgi:hypothetical protein
VYGIDRNMIILALISLLAISYWLCRYSKSMRPETGVLVVFTSLIVVLYVASLAGILSFAAYTIFCAGLLAFLLLVSAIMTRGVRSYRSNLSRVASFGALLCIAALLLWQSSQFALFKWDDIAHWGRATYLIAHQDRLVDGSSGILPQYLAYPPGTALFHYFFLKIAGYSEPHVVFANGVLLIACITAIVSPILERSRIAAAIVSALVLIAFLVSGFSISAIMPDSLLGLLFAASVIIALTETSLSVGLLANLPVLSALTLTKPIGFPLALLGISVTILTVLARRATAKPSTYAGAPFGLRAQISTKATLLIATASILVVLAINLSWQIHVSSIGGANNASTIFATMHTLMGEIFAGQSQGRLIPTLTGTWHQIHRQGNWKPSIDLLVVALTCAFLIASLLSPQGSRRPLLALSVLLPLGFLAYLLLLIALYLTYFSEYEASQAASLERYLASYLFAWESITLSVATLMLLDFASKAVTIAISIAIGVLIILVVPIVYHYLAITNLNDRALVAARADAGRLANEVLRIASPNDKIFFVKQNDEGFSMYAFQFAVLPHPAAQSWCWSLGPPYFVGDVWTCDQKLKNLIGGFRWLVIKKADTQFWEQNGNLFPASDRGLPSGIFAIDFKDGQPTMHMVN